MLRHCYIILSGDDQDDDTVDTKFELDGILLVL